MHKLHVLPLYLVVTGMVAFGWSSTVQAQSPQLSLIGRYETGSFDEGAAEIAAYDAATQRLFFVNAEANQVVALDLSDPTAPTEVFSIDMSPFGGGVNSVAVANGIMAVASEADPTQDPGTVVFFDTDGAMLGQVEAGALPDALVFTPDGTKVIVANEGEPNGDYTVDPEGTVSIIDLSGGAGAATVVHVGFTDFNGGGARASELPRDVRIYGPNASVAQDLEPEYVAVAPEGDKAYVTLQENNAIAVVDIATATVDRILALGYKDHTLPANALDVSDRDGAINIRNWPVYGMYHPDAIAAYQIANTTFLVTANEGDVRDYDGYSEEARVKDLTLDPGVFPDAEVLQADENLGRLTVTTATGDADGNINRLFAFGARSFSIWLPSGQLVYDSGDDIEQILARLLPDAFNATNTENDSFDNRSDDKGPEPEGITIGTAGRYTYAFVALERIGGILVYNISNPLYPRFVQYVNSRDFGGDAEAGTAGDLAPEGLVFIPATESPTGEALLVAANEVSGSVSVFSFSAPQRSAFRLQLLHASDLEAGTRAIEDAPRFASVVDALRDRMPGNTLVLSSGDNYIPGPFFNASNSDEVAAVVGAAGSGRADVAIMNAIGFDAAAIGNHEFDAGSGTFAALLGPDGDYPGAQFPYLSANLSFGAGSPLAPFVVENGQAPQPNSIAGSVIVERGRNRIGVIGATTPALGTISSPDGAITIAPGDAGDLAALAAIIQAEADALTADGVDKIILVSHLQQFDNELSVAPLLSGVDIIVAGGSDTRLADAEDRLRRGDEREGDYPTFRTGADGNPVAVVSTDGNYSYVGRLVISFDPSGILIPTTVDPNVSGAFATDTEGVRAVNGRPAQSVLEITATVQEVLEPTLSNVFGQTAVFLNGARGDVRTQETNLGNLSADANLAAAKAFDPTAVASIKNGGGIRADIGSFDPDTNAPIPPLGGQFHEDGAVSQLSIQNALAFNNGLTLLAVTAEELLAVVEHGVAATAPGATPGQFPQVGGMAFSFDPTLPANDRVRTLSILDEAGAVLDVVAQNGALVGDPTRTFRMVTLNFMADGGDGYPFPATGRVDLDDVLADPGVATFADPGSEQDALAEYLAARFTATPFGQADTPPEQDTRIQNLSVRADGVPTQAAGKGSDTGVQTASTRPASFALTGNYPNPFNPVTRITFDLPESAEVRVDVVDLLGRTVMALPAQPMAAGAARRIEINAANLASGTYFYRVSAQTREAVHHATGRMVLVK